MKRLLALILSLLLCLGVVSCGVYEGESSSSSDESSCISSAEPSSEATSSNESSLTESSSQEPTSESSSSSDNSSTDDDAENEPKKEILSGVTPEWFNAYVSYNDEYYHNVERTGDWDFATQVVLSFEEYKSYMYLPHLEKCPITEETFEDNFVILISGFSGHIRSEHVYYSGFERLDENRYYLRYNLVSWGQDFLEAEDPFRDICVIPRSLCSDDLSTIQVQIIQESYKFETGELYNSDCERFTQFPYYLPQ